MRLLVRLRQSIELLLGLLAALCLLADLAWREGGKEGRKPGQETEASPPTLDIVAAEQTDRASQTLAPPLQAGTARSRS